MPVVQRVLPFPRPAAATTFASLLALACLGGCESSGGPSSDDANDSASSDETGDEPSIFAMMTQVYTPDDRIVYLIPTEGLDFDGLTLERGREYPGVANMAAIGGKLLVSDGQEPIITEFDFGPDLEWQPGRTISFANYPLSDNANFYYQFVLDANTIYLPFDVTSRIVWDPTAFEIVGVEEDTTLESVKDGLILEPTGNRNSVRYTDNIFQAFMYHDEDWFDYGVGSAIAVYDPETHEERAVIEAPCAGLAIGTQAEDGSVYFASWDYTGLKALYGIGPAPCAVRVLPDLTLDAGFTTDFTDWTDGHYVSNFRYVRDGRAIGNVLHHEQLGADFSGEYDPAIGDTIWDTGPFWRLWVFDVENATATPVEGIAVEVGVIAQFAVLEDRTFVFLPYDDSARSKVYEVDLATAQATERADLPGDVYAWIQVR
jgi:hypothetical protein